jgi:hypothetical protein
VKAQGNALGKADAQLLLEALKARNNMARFDTTDIKSPVN